MFFKLHFKKNIRLIIFFSFFVILSIFFIDYFNNKKRSVLCKDCNVILIDLDTLSANHLPCYGYERNTAPNLCDFAKKNVFFKNAYSNSSWTLPSDVSLFTGLLPSDHGVNLTNDSLKESHPFLPEILQKNGYKTIFSLPPNNPSFPVSKVYYKGINKIIYYDYYANTRKKELELFKKSVKSGRKTFLFLHTYRLHHPYLIEDKPQLYSAKKIENLPLNFDQVYNNNFSDEFIKYLENQLIEDFKSESGIKGTIVWSGAFLKLIDDLERSKNMASKKQVLLEFYEQNPGYLYDYLRYFNWLRMIDKNNPQHVNYIKALYDQKINELDEAIITELINVMKDPNLNKKTILVILASHGEEFMENGFILHESLYDGNLRIPLIIYFPGVVGKKIDSPVQIVDLAPTILDILGIKNNYNFRGMSITDLIRGKPQKDRLLIADGYNLENIAVRYGRWKTHLFYDKKQLLPYLLYDISKDPQEQNNLLQSKFEIAKEIVKEYKLFMHK